MRLASAALAALATACAGTAQRPAAVASAPVPFGEPRPFAALYRLDCCGQRDLIAAVRGDGAHLAVTVAAGPAGAVLEAWLAPGGGWLRARGERCVQRLAAGTLPLPGGGAMPLDPALAAALLRGTVPGTAAPVPGRTGWLAAALPGGVARWQVGAGVVVALEVVGAAPEPPLLTVALSRHHGRVPGRLRFGAGEERGELRLAEWRESTAPGEPAWLAAPECGEAP